VTPVTSSVAQAANTKVAGIAKNARRISRRVNLVGLFLSIVLTPLNLCLPSKIMKSRLAKRDFIDRYTDSIR
jgi:hypothetical protein